MTKIRIILGHTNTVPDALKKLFSALHEERDILQTMSSKKTQRLRSLANFLMSLLPRDPSFEFFLNREEKIEPITLKVQVLVVLWMMHNEMVTELQQFYEMHKHIKGNALECVLAFLQASHERMPEYTSQWLWKNPETSISSFPPSLACVRRVNEQVIMHLKFAPASECWRFQTLIAEQLSELPIRKQINKEHEMQELFGERCVINDLKPR
jgi:hypothetical protein